MVKNIVELTSESFDKEITKSTVPVLVDFWAEWCAPCKALLPVMEQIAAESDGKYKVAKVNVSEYPQLAARFDVTSIPAMLFFKSGKEESRMIGINPKAKIAQKLHSLI